MVMTKRNALCFAYCNCPLTAFDCMIQLFLVSRRPELVRVHNIMAGNFVVIQRPISIVAGGPFLLNRMLFCLVPMTVLISGPE